MRNVVFPRNMVSLQATGWNISRDIPRLVIASSSAEYICFSRKASIFPGYTPWQSFTSYCSPTLAVSLNASKEQWLLLIAPCIPGKAISAGYSVLLEGSVHFTLISTDCVWNSTYWRANICRWLEELGYVSPGSSTARAQRLGLFITHSKHFNAIIPHRNPSTSTSSDCVCKGCFRKVWGKKTQKKPKEKSTLILPHWKYKSDIIGISWSKTILFYFTTIQIAPLWMRL